MRFSDPADSSLGALRRQMHEVAALSHDDPERVAFVERVGQLGGELEHEWLELLQFDEELRVKLARPVAPPDLRRRLLIIPDQQSPGLEVPANWRHLWGRLAVAASLLVVGLAALLLLTSRPGGGDLTEFANLMVTAHQSQPELTLVTEDWGMVRTSFADQMPFDPIRPETPPEWELLGASLTALGGHNVIYTRWSDGERTYSLSVYCAEQFGLPRHFDPKLVQPEFAAPDPDCRVVLWSDSHCDYALVITGPLEDSSAQNLIRRAA